MAHSEAVTAVLTSNEPSDGTKLIYRDGSDWRVIFRDDNLAKSTGFADHWYDGGDDQAEPMSLHQHLKYADEVYALGDRLAAFR